MTRYQDFGTTWPAPTYWCAAVGGGAPGLLAADNAQLLARGEARPTLAVWAAGQAWLAQAGAILLAHGCPAHATRTQVRLDHLAAGYTAGTAHALAVALGLRSRPVGSWQCADLGKAVGAPPGKQWIVHGLALGTATRSCPR